MRSEWQSHCLVITVWWTSIVFRLVETEACWASARSTNANLFHVDIISHCLLSNHNTCLTFFSLFFAQWKCFAWEFILFWLTGGRRTAKGQRRDHLCDAQRWGLFILHGFWVMWLFFFFTKREKKTGSRNCSDSPLEEILSKSYCEHDLICQAKPPHFSIHHQSCTTRQIISTGDFTFANSRGRQ